MPEEIKPFKRTEKQIEAVAILAMYTFILLVGGSRSGKTFIAVRSIIIRALKTKSRHLIIRLRFNHVKTSIWYDTFPKVMALCFPEVEYKENKTDWFIRFPNGSEIWMAGIDSKKRMEKILGTEFSTIYINEGSQVEYDAFMMLKTRAAERTLLQNKIYVDCNPPTKKHWTYKLFYEYEDPSTLHPQSKELHGKLLMNPTDNVENISGGYIESMLKTLPKRQRARFLEGVYVDDVDGSIWTLDLLNSCISKHSTLEELKKDVGIWSISIGVDPSTKNKDDSDLCGIVVIAACDDGKFYVIADLSLKASPGAWADAVINAYAKYDANAIIVETNQGGEMVKEILNLKNFYGKIIEVHASKSKHARAEPVEAMYEQGKVEHLNIPSLKYLEDEMTTYVPMESKKSPDRLDALVWAMSYYLKEVDVIAKYSQINYRMLGR